MIDQKVLPLFQGVFTVILLILVIRQRKQTSETRLFSLFLLSMSLWGFLIGIMRNTSNLILAEYWERAALVMIALTAVSFYFFTVSYAKSMSRIYLALAMVYLLVTLAIAPTKYFVRGIGVDNFGNYPILGFAFYPWLVIIYLLIVLAMINLNRARKASGQYEVRNRYLYLILGAALCLLGGLFDVLPVLGVPLFPGSIIANIGFALLTSLAILQYHLFDIRVVFRSSLAYLITGVLVAIPTVGLGVLWAYLARQWGFSFWVSVLPPAFLILAIPPLWRRVENIVTQAVRREKYTYLKALEEFSNSKVSVSKLDELCSLIVTLVNRAIFPTFLYLFVQREDGCFEMVGYHPAIPQSEPVRLYIEHPLAQVFQRRREMIWRRQLNVFPELQAMSKQDMDILGRINAELYFPIGVGELSGILALGPKSPGQLYSREDLEFLNTLLRQVGLELENIYLFSREKAQRQRIEQFNAERATFLDALAHEMKTPLTSAIAYSELMVAELIDHRGNIPMLAAHVQSAINNLGRIVNDFLEFGRIQQTKIKCIIKSVDINALILKVKEESNLLLLRRQQKLTLNIPETKVMVRADPDRVKQVLHNLINNASKFSMVGCEINLRVKVVDRYLHIEVQDSAERIAEEDMGHLFTPYYRGTHARQNQLPGLGLGLFICKELIEAQEGRIWLEDRKSQGNIFCISLPIEHQNSNETTNN